LRFQGAAGSALELWMRPADSVGCVVELLQALGASSKVLTQPRLRGARQS
jgi:hypothetical protein